MPSPFRDDVAVFEEDPEQLYDRLPQPYRMITKLLELEILDRAWLEIIRQHPELQLDERGLPLFVRENRNLDCSCTPSAISSQTLKVTCMNGHIHGSDMVFVGTAMESVVVIDGSCGRIQGTILLGQGSNAVKCVSEPSVTIKAFNGVRIAACVIVPVQPLPQTEPQPKTPTQPDSSPPANAITSRVTVAEVCEDVRGGNIFHRTLGFTLIDGDVIGCHMSPSGMWLVVLSNDDMVRIYQLGPASSDSLKPVDTLTNIQSIREDAELEVHDQNANLLTFAGPMFIFSTVSNPIQSSSMPIPDCFLPRTGVFFTPVRKALRGLFKKDTDSTRAEDLQSETLVLIPRLCYYWEALRPGIRVPSASQSQDEESKKSTKKPAGKKAASKTEEEKPTTYSKPWQLGCWELTSYVTASSITSDRAILALGLESGLVVTYNTINFTLLSVLGSFPSSVTALSFYGSQLAIAADLQGHLASFSLSALVTTSHNGTVAKLTDLPPPVGCKMVKRRRDTGEAIAVLNCMRRLPLLVAQSTDGLVCAYDVEDLQLLGKLCLSTVRSMTSSSSAHNIHNRITAQSILTKPGPTASNLEPSLLPGLAAGSESRFDETATDANAMAISRCTSLTGFLWACDQSVLVCFATPSESSSQTDLERTDDQSESGSYRSTSTRTLDGQPRIQTCIFKASDIALNLCPGVRSLGQEMEEVFLLDMFRRLTSEQRMMAGLKWDDVPSQHLFRGNMGFADNAGPNAVGKGRRPSISGSMSSRGSDMISGTSSARSIGSLRIAGTVSARSIGSVHSTHSVAQTHSHRKSKLNPAGSESQLTAEKLQGLELSAVGASKVDQASEVLQFKDPARLVLASLITRQAESLQRDKRIEARKKELLEMLA